jgi:phospholipid/cholesterol/gamma-HCH transport system permease protein
MEYVQTSPLEAELRLSGRVRFAEAERLWSELGEAERHTVRGQTLNLEMSGVNGLDGGAMALLAHLRAGLHRRGVKAEFLGAPEHVQAIISLYGGDHVVARLKRRRPLGTLNQIGQATLGIVLEVKRVLGFFGEMVISSAWLLRAPRSANWRELAPTMERAGADAFPIVVLINFLVGLAMAFQAAVQLKRFGAEILVADLIGISVTRELAPLMTAIVVCGRSGAAFAAELGFMKVNEEIDALRTMGFGPMRFLVLPRALALILVVPLLTLVADVAGVLGGLVVGVLNLDLTALAYLNQSARVVSLWDISSGLIKSVLFAVAIALIACQQGLATSGGAEGVGRRTTSTVVVTLFTLILIDATVTVLFRAAGL